MKQGQNLKAIQSFTMRKHGARGRAALVKVGDVFWVTSSTYNNKEAAFIDREGKGVISHGYKLDLADINNLFDVIE
jgi:hypothetical protein